jgi:hypothetical protein
LGEPFADVPELTPYRDDVWLLWQDDCPVVVRKGDFLVRGREGFDVYPRDYFLANFEEVGTSY